MVCILFGIGMIWDGLGYWAEWYTKKYRSGVIFWWRDVKFLALFSSAFFALSLGTFAAYANDLRSDPPKTWTDGLDLVAGIFSLLFALVTMFVHWKKVMNKEPATGTTDGTTADTTADTTDVTTDVNGLAVAAAQAAMGLGSRGRDPVEDIVMVPVAAGSGHLAVPVAASELRQTSASKRPKEDV